jgi:hypothetical protein
MVRRTAFFKNELLNHIGPTRYWQNAGQFRGEYLFLEDSQKSLLLRRSKSIELESRQSEPTTRKKKGVT